MALCIYLRPCCNTDYFLVNTASNNDRCSGAVPGKGLRSRILYQFSCIGSRRSTASGGMRRAQCGSHSARRISVTLGSSTVVLLHSPRTSHTCRNPVGCILVILEAAINPHSNVLGSMTTQSLVSRCVTHAG